MLSVTFLHSRLEHRSITVSYCALLPSPIEGYSISLVFIKLSAPLMFGNAQSVDDFVSPWERSGSPTAGPGPLSIYGVPDDFPTTGQESEETFDYDLSGDPSQILYSVSDVDFPTEPTVYDSMDMPLDHTPTETFHSPGEATEASGSSRSLVEIHSGTETALSDSANLCMDVSSAGSAQERLESPTEGYNGLVPGIPITTYSPVTSVQEFPLVPQATEYRYQQPVNTYSDQESQRIYDQNILPPSHDIGHYMPQPTYIEAKDHVYGHRHSLYPRPTQPQGVEFAQPNSSPIGHPIDERVQWPTSVNPQANVRQWYPIAPGRQAEFPVPTQIHSNQNRHRQAPPAFSFDPNAVVHQPHEAYIQPQPTFIQPRTHAPTYNETRFASQHQRVASKSVPHHRHSVPNLKRDVSPSRTRPSRGLHRSVDGSMSSNSIPLQPSSVSFFENQGTYYVEDYRRDRSSRSNGSGHGNNDNGNHFGNDCNDRDYFTPPIKRIKQGTPRRSRDASTRRPIGVDDANAALSPNTSILLEFKSLRLLCKKPTPGCLYPISLSPERKEYIPFFPGPTIFEDSRYRHLKIFYNDPAPRLSPQSYTPNDTETAYPSIGKCTHACFHSEEVPPNVSAMEVSQNVHSSLYPLNGAPFRPDQIADYQPPLARFEPGENLEDSFLPANALLPQTHFAPTLDTSQTLQYSLLYDASDSMPLETPAMASSVSPSLSGGYRNFALADFRTSSPDRESPTSAPASSASGSSGTQKAKLGEAAQKSLKSPSTLKVQAWNLNGQVNASKSFVTSMLNPRRSSHYTNASAAHHGSESAMELKFHMQRKRIILCATAPNCGCRHTLAFSFSDVAAFIIQSAYISSEDYRATASGDYKTKYLAITLGLSRGGEYTRRDKSPQNPSKRSSFEQSTPNSVTEALDNETSANFNFPPAAKTFPLYSSLTPQHDQQVPFNHLPEDYLQYPFPEVENPESMVQTPSFPVAPTTSDSADSSSSEKRKTKLDSDSKACCAMCGPLDPLLAYHPAMGLPDPKSGIAPSSSTLGSESVFSSSEHHTGERYITIVLERTSSSSSSSSLSASGLSTSNSNSHKALERLLLLDPYLAFIARAEPEYATIRSPLPISIPSLPLLRDRLLCQFEMIHNYLRYYGRTQFALTVALDVRHDHAWDSCAKTCCSSETLSNGAAVEIAAREGYEGEGGDRRSSLRESTVAQAGLEQSPKSDAIPSSIAWYLSDLSRLSDSRGDELPHGREVREVPYTCECLHLGHSRTISFPRPPPDTILPFDANQGLIVDQLVPEHQWNKQNSLNSQHPSLATLSSHGSPYQTLQSPTPFECPLGCPPCDCPPSAHQLDRFVFPPQMVVSVEDMKLCCPVSANKKNKKGEDVPEEAPKAAGDAAFPTYTKRNCSRTTLILSKERIEYVYGQKIRLLYDERTAANDSQC